MLSLTECVRGFQISTLCGILINMPYCFALEVSKGLNAADSVHDTESGKYDRVNNGDRCRSSHYLQKNKLLSVLKIICIPIRKQYP